MNHLFFQNYTDAFLPVEYTVNRLAPLTTIQKLKDHPLSLSLAPSPMVYSFGPSPYQPLSPESPPVMYPQGYARQDQPPTTFGIPQALVSGIPGQVTYQMARQNAEDNGSVDAGK